MDTARTPPDDVLTRPAPAPDLVLRYGSNPARVADVRLPQASRAPAPLVLFLHGGFWRAAYDRAHAGPLATALAAAGYAVCVPEFRRTGQAGGGWPGTFDDVAAAVDRLPGLVRAAAGPGTVAPGPVLLAGHSAGGHLALWAAGKHRLPAGERERASGLPAGDLRRASGLPAGERERASGLRARGVVALGPVTGLADCHSRRLGNGAADALMGGGPAQYPDRYRAADPVALLPLGCPVRLVHGARDDVVPLAMSRHFLAQARDAGDDITLTELQEATHFDVIDPRSGAWPSVLGVFMALAPPARARPSTGGTDSAAAR
jgi:acetyl esterase/lipase